MIGTTLPQESRDAINCKLFPQSLKGSTLKWICELKPATINSFKEMTRRFLENYSANIYMGMTLEELYTIVQQPDELLGAYIKRFSKAIAKLSNCHDTIALFALKKRLLQSSNFLKEICSQ